MSISRNSLSIRGTLTLLIGICVFGGNAVAVQAQGLIWSFPEDGAWVRYEGRYLQVDVLPKGDRTIEWIRHVTIKSVGKEMADYQGKNVPCRWIEIKTQTGRASESGLNTGPVGTRIYKVLVPEHRVIGKIDKDGRVQDQDTIPVSFLPIVKGWRKVSDMQSGTKPIKAKVLQIYPTISLIRHYETFAPESNQAEDPDVGVEGVLATRFTGSIDIESPTSQSKHEADIWRTKDIPFGLARWKVKISIKKKPQTDARSSFVLASTINVDMKAQEVGTDAKSELAVP